MTFCEKKSLLAAALSASALLGACGNQTAAKPLFKIENCQHLVLTDAADGRRIVGVEDLAVDRKGGRLLVSAYDRRGVERAARSNKDVLPAGGIYLIYLDELVAANGDLSVRPLLESSAVAGGVRPHGLDIDGESGEVTFINRPYFRVNGRWRMTPQFVRIDLSGTVLSIENDAHCSANDLSSFSGNLLVTIDHAGCGWRAGAEDVLGAKISRVIDGDGDVVLGGLGYANGIVVTPEGEIVVAATREKSLYIVSAAKDASVGKQFVKLQAAPDNLTLSDAGRIVAAVHPSLARMGLQRRLGIGSSPSRVVEVDLGNGEQQVLFDDPDAKLISAATAAIATNGMLIIGSVIDPGIVVCRHPAPQQ